MAQPFHPDLEDCSFFCPLRRAGDIDTKTYFAPFFFKQLYFPNDPPPPFFLLIIFIYVYMVVGNQNLGLNIIYSQIANIVVYIYEYRIEHQDILISSSLLSINELQWNYILLVVIYQLKPNIIMWRNIIYSSLDVDRMSEKNSGRILDSFSLYPKLVNALYKNSFTESIIKL